MTKFNPVIEDNPTIGKENLESMQPIIFQSKGKKLIGTLFKVSGTERKPIVFLLHGFPGNEKNSDIAHAIKRFGFNVIIFHYRGSWGSEGDFSISNSLEDLYSAIDYINKPDVASSLNIDATNIILIGHSFGAFLAFLTSIKYPQIKNIASLSGFNFGFFTDYIIQNPQFLDVTMDELSQGAMLLKGTSGEKIYNEMLLNKDEWNLLKLIPELKKKNILLVGAEYDYVAPLEIHHHPMVEGLKQVGAKFKSEVYKSGHSFSSSRIKLTTEIINWLKNLK
ncbi:MAG: alpha/beta fold hydrolase [Melioribacteraceae bacterium]|nr:alpha/beta fold hydrolase [Melioribacteraceae bacterium]